MGFRIGERVVCVPLDEWFDLVTEETIPGPKKGEIYTITSIMKDKKHTLLSLAEFNPDGECWDARFFRPLVSTDISIFHSILANPHKELETCE